MARSRNNVMKIDIGGQQDVMSDAEADLINAMTMTDRAHFTLIGMRLRKFCEKSQINYKELEFLVSLSGDLDEKARNQLNQAVKACIVSALSLDANSADSSHIEQPKVITEIEEIVESDQNDIPTTSPKFSI